MSSFTASAINSRKRGRLARSLHQLGFSLATVVLSANVYAGCQYVVTNQWGEGFNAAIKITNTGTSTINGWTVGWQYSGDNRMTNGWSATYSGTNPYSATNLSWNGTIAPNQTVEIGFQGSKTGATAEVPQVTGAVCGSATSSVSSSASSIRSSVSSSISSSSKSSVASSSVPSSSSSKSSVASSSVLSSSSSKSSVASSSVLSSSSSKSSVASSSVLSSSSSKSSVASSSVLSSSSSSVASSSVPSSSSSKASSSAGSSSVAAGVFFSDGFENGTVGAAPAGWSTFIGWIFDGNNNSQSSGNYALIDNSKSYNGGNSIHFRGGANPAQIVRTLPAGIQHLHMRAYVNLSKAMGNQAGDNHEHIMGIKRTPDANDEIRVGQIKGVLGTNHIPSDNIAPKMSQWYSGPQMAANTWYCVETAYYADTAYDELRMWVNGTLVHSITSASDWNNGALPADWLSDKFTYAMLGFHSFSGNTADVWMDDIVLSTQAIGCGATPGSSSSSVASSVASSSSVSSRSSVASSVSVSSSSIASSSSRSSVASSVVSSVASSVTSSANSSANPNAAWDLDTTTSYLNFVTTKNTHNVEAQSFTSLSGYIGNDGVAILSIDLNSVSTNNTVRDQRIRDLLFETATYPAATVTVTVPSTLLSSLAVGQTAPTDVSATISLHGLTTTVTTRVSVQRLSSSRILVQSIAPVLTKAGDYNLTAGLETLRSLVALTSISAAVPVDFALVFNAR